MKHLNKLMIFFLLIVIFCGCTKKQEEAASTKDSATEKTITGIVFFDQNNNSVFDENEKGLAGIKITGDSNTVSVVTDQDGAYSIKLKKVPMEIKIEESSVLAGYTLTTNNSVQTFSVEQENYKATPIGYSKTAASKEVSFEKSFSNKKDYDNYYFDLIVSGTGVANSSNKLWVIGSSFKSETQGTVTFVNQKKKNMGVYIQAQNQVIITPLQEMEKLTTPFTVVDDIPKEVLSKMEFLGKEKLDDKNVLIFEGKSNAINVKLYIWEEEGIIIRMDTKKGQHTDSYYFKDLKFDSVKDSDITYPAGANVMDLTAY